MAFPTLIVVIPAAEAASAVDGEAVTAVVLMLLGAGIGWLLWRRK